MIDYGCIGRRIYELRTRRRISQEKLAEMVSLSPSYVSRIETAQKHLSLETLAKIAEALGVKVGHLLSDTPAAEYANYDEEMLLSGCNEKERYIIINTLLSLKQSLLGLRKVGL